MATTPCYGRRARIGLASDMNPSPFNLSQRRIALGNMWSSLRRYLSGSWRGLAGSAGTPDPGECQHCAGVSASDVPASWHFRLLPLPALVLAEPDGRLFEANDAWCVWSGRARDRSLGEVAEAWLTGLPGSSELPAMPHVGLPLRLRHRNGHWIDCLGTTGSTPPPRLGLTLRLWLLWPIPGVGANVAAAARVRDLAVGADSGPAIPQPLAWEARLADDRFRRDLAVHLLCLTEAALMMVERELTLVKLTGQSEGRAATTVAAGTHKFGRVRGAEPAMNPVTAPMAAALVVARQAASQAAVALASPAPDQSDLAAAISELAWQVAEASYIDCRLVGTPPPVMLAPGPKLAVIHVVRDLLLYLGPRNTASGIDIELTATHPGWLHVTLRRRDAGVDLPLGVGATASGSSLRFSPHAEGLAASGLRLLGVGGGFIVGPEASAAGSVLASFRVPQCGAVRPASA